MTYDLSKALRSHSDHPADIFMRAADEIDVLQKEKEFNASQYRAEIERLTAELAEWKAAADTLRREYHDKAERLTAENERLAAGRDAAIRTLADSRFPPVTRINDAIAILSRSGVVQQTTQERK